MKIRFQADADLNHIIVKAILRREPTVDFQTVHAANLSGLNDEEVLTKASEAGRVLVTHDRKTMPHHFAEFIITHPSPGVLIIPKTIPTIRIVEDLILIWTVSDPEEWMNRIYYLPI